MERVNSEIKKFVSRIIDTELTNTNITGLITVTEVDTAKDFSNSKIYVSLLGSQSVKNTIAALNKAKGFIRSRMAKELNFRKTPELFFYYDEASVRGNRIDKIIEELKQERKENGLEEDTDENKEEE